MKILSNYLIKTQDDYFNLIHECEETKYQQYTNTDKLLFDNIEPCLIEHVEEKNYSIKEQEIKYKIFDDISSITKNNTNDKIELVINISKTSDILTINKIKLSKNIKKYIFDIFVTLNNKIILNRDNLYNTKINLSKESKFDDSEEENYNNLDSINCSQGEVNIHIVLKPNSLNDILNNYIYISYSFINFKNKIKFR
jgi:hypothetical protein